MKITPRLKSLTLLGLATLSLAAGTSQADSGYFYFGGNQNPNPWMANQAMQQARYAAALKQHQEQLDQRQDAQMQRILNGMENGKLTLREATSLIREHLAIASLERKYLADGRLGPNELAQLEQRLDEADRNIRFEIRDREQNGHMDKPGDKGRLGEMGRSGDMGRPGDNDRPGDYGRR